MEDHGWKTLGWRDRSQMSEKAPTISRIRLVLSCHLSHGQKA
jgi:hypothetical protein